jgi:antitoxin component of RelBE/YafQ-DinJ toxin-antitoxin module
MARPSNHYDKIVRFRIGTEEKAALAALCEKQNVSESEAIRRLLRAGAGKPLPVARVDRAAIKALEDQLRRVGGNFNQAVRAMNEGRVGYEPALNKSLLALTNAVLDIRIQMQAMTRPARSRVAPE